MPLFRWAKIVLLKRAATELFKRRSHDGGSPSRRPTEQKEKDQKDQKNEEGCEANEVTKSIINDGDIINEAWGTPPSTGRDIINGTEEFSTDVDVFEDTDTPDSAFAVETAGLGPQSDPSGLPVGDGVGYINAAPAHVDVDTGLTNGAIDTLALGNALTSTLTHTSPEIGTLTGTNTNTPPTHVDVDTQAPTTSTATHIGTPGSIGTHKPIAHYFNTIFTPPHTIDFPLFTCTFSPIPRPATPTTPISRPTTPLYHPIIPPTPPPTMSTIDELQTDEQRRILDTITEIRKQGLESVLSLPQIVVCGDQSAGKSSVLEALAEIPFPRNDNLCTRFATEISFRREAVDRLTVKVIPHESRSATEQEAIRAFAETITDFEELPSIMDQAMDVMGIASDEDIEDDAPRSAFSRDILSIEIEGPERPQLTLVDIPGLIQSSTKGVSVADVATVSEITDYYIKQPRTICLAVVSATNDAANQPILQRVRDIDPRGERTLGVITKPDRLPAGSGSEAKFIELARNQDVFFKLGWHVIKNRSFEESHCSFAERNTSEMAYFRTSNFNNLPPETVGIDALRTRLSHVLFDHVRSELPRLGEELDKALQAASKELRQMGTSRSTPVECRDYLVKLSLEHYDICRAAVNGNYELPYFSMPTAQKGGNAFAATSPFAIARLRAMVQHVNLEFSEKFRLQGHKYMIDVDGRADSDNADDDDKPETSSSSPKFLSKRAALEWVRQALLRNRGKELMGNYNPLLLGELFWEQSEGWRQLAVEHIEMVGAVCERFLGDLLMAKTPEDVRPRVWSAIVQVMLKKRRDNAFTELNRLVQDAREFPINYNHYYTDNIRKRRQGRLRAKVDDALEAGIYESEANCGEGHKVTSVDVNTIMDVLTQADKSDSIDMDQFGCEDILDCLVAIYKVQHKVFTANIVTQVIERHIIRGLEQIFSPRAVVGMLDADVLRVVGENAAARRQRVFLLDRVRKLEGGREIFRGVLGFGGRF